MPFIATADDLEFSLDEDLTWRVKEVSALKGLIDKSAPGLQKNAALRAALPMLYAHWEGFVKRSSDQYLTFVYGSRPRLSALKPGLAYSFLEPRFRAAGGASAAFTPQAAVKFVKEIAGTVAKPNPKVMVNTKANLRYEVLEEIVSRLAVSDFLQMTTAARLNEQLCDKRNFIAHGESVPVTEEGFSSLRDEILDLMRSYKDRLVTAASNREYLAA